MQEYTFDKYIYFERWSSYWYQLAEVLRSAPKSVLIVGKGDGVVGDILKQNFGVSDVKTVDIEKSLAPDIVSSVDSLSLSDKSFDCVLCAEVLEHLPFEKFMQCLKELGRVSKKNVVMSLPHFGPAVKISFKLPFLREIKFAFKIPFPVKHKINGEHYWEIDKRGYSRRKIRSEIEKVFTIKKEFVPYENQYHRFYILEKK